MDSLTYHQRIKIENVSAMVRRLLIDCGDPVVIANVINKTVQDCLPYQIGNVEYDEESVLWDLMADYADMIAREVEAREIERAAA
jgi:ethanolamine utilization protein EutQ (cupin superfamily)